MTTAKTSVRAEVSARSRGLYDVTFVPQDVLPHFINITFNEEHVKRSPFKCEIVTGGDDATTAMRAAVNGAPVSSAADFAGRGKPTAFDLTEEELLAGDLASKLKIVDPQGKTCRFERTNTRSGGAR